MAIDKQRLYQFLQQIPKGKVSTYKQLALALGTKSYRAIGQLVKNNPNPPKIPCHRIVNSNGKIGGYLFGKEQKIAILKEEGLTIESDEIINFNKNLFEFNKISN